MEDRNSLYQYVVEMENWLEQFQYTMQELEKNPRPRGISFMLMG